MRDSDTAFYKRAMASTRPDPLARAPTELLADLRARYDEPQRYYHDWSHIEAMLDHWIDRRDALVDEDAVLFAILYHDAIYDPRANDDEERSARLLANARAPLTVSGRLRAEAAIRATKGHVVSDEVDSRDRPDVALFLDMDLAILGATRERFDRYEAQVRREYAHVSDHAYRAGRTAVLRRFAERTRLYLSDWGYEAFEDRARANIARLLDRIQRSAFRSA